MMPKWSYVDDVKLVKSQLGDRGKYIEFPHFPTVHTEFPYFPTVLAKHMNLAFIELHAVTVSGCK